jgi:hypothetical protein
MTPIQEIRKPIPINSLVLTERDFFTEPKNALSEVIQKYFTATENEKIPLEERLALDAQLLGTLRGFSELNPLAVEEHAQSFGSEFIHIAREIKKKKHEDLPANIIDRVSAHFLLELATPEAIRSYELGEIVKLEGLSKEDHDKLSSLFNENETPLTNDDWAKEYQPTVKKFIEGLDKEGIFENNYLASANNMIKDWKENVPTKAKREITALRNEAILKTTERVKQATLSDCLRPTPETSRDQKQQLIENKLRVETFATLALSAKHILLKKDATAVEQKVNELVSTLGKTEGGLYTTMLLACWREGEVAPQHRLLGNRGYIKIDTVGAPDGPRYIFDLGEIVDPAIFDRAGDLLLESRQKTELYTLLHNRESDSNSKAWPDYALSRVFDCFIDAAYVTKSKYGEYKLKKKNGTYVSSLSFDSIRSVMLAYKYMTSSESVKPVINSLDDGDRIYDENKELIKVEKLHFDITGPGTMHLSDAEYGHKNLNSKFLTKEIKRIASLPENERPSVVVMSDLVFGTFIVNNNKKRRAFAKGAKHLETQFALANKAVTQLAEAGIKVVVLQGDNAFAIADDHAIKSVQRLSGLAKPLLGISGGHIDYATANRIRQNEKFDQHFTFEWDVVYPYCVRSGRSLLNADEVSKMTDGAVQMEEYLMLFDAYEKQLAGEEIPPEYLDVINFSNIAFPGKKFDDGIHIVDDAHVDMKNADGTIRYSSRLFARFGLSPQTMPTDPITKLKTFMTAMSAEGEAPPDFSVLTNQKWLIGLQGDNDSWALSTPGLQETDINEKGSILRTTGDISWRQIMRGVTAKPATLKYDRDSEGTVTYEVSNELLNQKSEATEPTAIAFIHDLQVGSHSAHLDLPVKSLDYIVSKIAPYKKVILGMNGDISHGLNHPGSAIQNGPTLLNGLDPQEKMGKRMFTGALDHYSHAELDNIQKVLITLGNHEWNSGNKDFGSTHSLWIQDAFANILSSKVGPGQLQNELKERVSFHDTMHTKDGDFMVNAWTALEPVGAYNLMMQHLILDKMAKGPGGPSILQLKSFFSGIGSLGENVDLAEFGHWHNGQFMLFGNKVGAIAPAQAGQSYYEWIRAYRPKTGLFVMHVGGGKPVQLQFVSTQALHNHQIKDGVFSPESLASRNFFDDPNFDPMRNGYADYLGLHSALQKQLWRMAQEIAYGHAYSI